MSDPQEFSAVRFGLCAIAFLSGLIAVVMSAGAATYQVSSIFSGNRVALGLPSISRQSF